MHGGGLEISGRHVDEGYAYLPWPLKYERQVFKALAGMPTLIAVTTPWPRSGNPGSRCALFGAVL